MLRRMEFLYPLFINDLKMVHDEFHQPYDGSSYSFKENKKSSAVISHSKALPNESFNKAYLESSSTRQMFSFYHVINVMQVTHKIDAFTYVTMAGKYICV